MTTNNKQRAYFAAKRKAEKLDGNNVPCPDFTAYLEAKNIQKKYFGRYAAQVERFKNWLQTNKDRPLENAEKKDVLDYLQYLQETLNLSNSTRQQTLSMLQHYYTYLLQKQEIKNNPTQLIKLRGTKKKLLPKVLSMEEMNELLDVYYHVKVRLEEEYKHIRQRNYLILSLCVYQGLNRSELEALTLGDVNLQKAIINIPAMHKSNARVLPLQALQIGIFYEYLQNSRPLFKEQNEMLINSKPEIQKMMKAMRKLYPKFMELKQLRASIITYWIQTEGLRKAQYKAGHRYISSTEEYLANDLESLKDDIEKFHPL